MDASQGVAICAGIVRFHPPSDEYFAFNPGDDETASTGIFRWFEFGADAQDLGNGNARLGELFQQSRLGGQVVGRQDALLRLHPEDDGGRVDPVQLPTEVGLALESFDVGDEAVDATGR